MMEMEENSEEMIEEEDNKHSDAIQLTDEEDNSETDAGIDY